LEIGGNLLTISSVSSDSSIVAVQKTLNPTHICYQQGRRYARRYFVSELS
jgi:hypothetical protein